MATKTTPTLKLAKPKVVPAPAPVPKPVVVPKPAPVVPTLKPKTVKASKVSKNAKVDPKVDLDAVREKMLKANPNLRIT